MTPHSPAWYDEQYNNRGRIPEHPAILQHWFDSSAATRARLRSVLDVPYGAGDGEQLDIFLPPDEPGSASRPVLVYIHGGYWRALDKRDQSFVAEPFVNAGAMVVLPNYALCPAVRITHIVMQMVRAVAWLHRHAAAYGGDPRRIVVAGHSAGGHLAAMLLACDWQVVDADLPPDVVHAALSISGVFELEPLRHAPFLATDLQLDAQAVRRLSPARMPAPRRPLVAVVGGDESEEFLRQHALISDAWQPQVNAEIVPGRHHMNVLHDMTVPGSALQRHALRLLGLGG